MKPKRAAALLMKAKGALIPAEVVSWGFAVEKEKKQGADLMVELSSFANENQGNVWVSGCEGELKSTQSLFPEVEIKAIFKDEYGQGYCLSPKFEKNYNDKKLFDALKKLKPADAKKLANDPCDLNLDATDLTTESAMELAKHKGGSITFSELTSLTKSAARELAGYQGELCFEALENLSEASAKELVWHTGKLDFLALRSLTDGAARELARHKGELYIMAPPESDTAGTLLANHKALTYIRDLPRG